MRTTRYLIALAGIYFAVGYTIGRLEDTGSIKLDVAECDAQCPLHEHETVVADSQPAVDNIERIRRRVIGIER